MGQFDQEHFREEALKNAYTPEGLDQMVQITKPHGWLILLSILLFLVAFILWSIFGRITTEVIAPCVIYPASGGPVLLTTETDGYMMDIQAKPGRHIQSGIPLFSLKNGNKITTMSSPMEGELISYLVVPGQFLTPGTAYALFLPYSKDNEVLAQVFIPPTDGKLVDVGMQAHIALDQANPQEFGYLNGSVSNISIYPKTKEALMNDLQNDFLATMMSRDGAPFEALVTLIPVPNQPGQYQWTKKNVKNIEVTPGSLCTARILTSREAPITLVIPALLSHMGS